MGPGHPSALSHRRLSALSIWLCAAVLNGCVSTVGEQRAEPTGIVIEGIVIRNELLFPVTDVLVLIPVTGAFVGCGNVTPRSQCRTSFEALDYAGNALVVSWKEYGEPQQTPEFVIDVPEGLDMQRPAWLEVVIFATGQAGAKLIQ